jgi:hypothetical protein
MENIAKIFGSESQGKEDEEEKLYGVLEKLMQTLMSPEVLKTPMNELKQKVLFH